MVHPSEHDLLGLDEGRGDLRRAGVNFITVAGRPRQSSGESSAGVQYRFSTNRFGGLTAGDNSLIYMALQAGFERYLRGENQGIPWPLMV